MRISDWSSDVCSSDLHHGVNRQQRAEQGRQQPHVDTRQRRRAQPHGDSGHEQEGPKAPEEDKGDRKSVVEGKSVSVRVDLGGRRIIKQQITRRTTDYTSSTTTNKKHTMKTIT